MASLTVKTTSPSLPTVAGATFDPFAWARSLLRWDPSEAMAPPAGALEPPAQFQPAFEVKETREAYEFLADLPGVRDEDVEIALAGNRLTIGGKREAAKKDETDRFYTFERSYGSFLRTFALPDDVDGEHVRAELRSGVLLVVVPKRPEALARKIRIGETAKR